MESKSKGHVMFFFEEELFVTESGELYRAPKNRPINSDGYRMGARWEAPAHMAQDFINRFKDYAVQNPLL